MLVDELEKLLDQRSRHPGEKWQFFERKLRREQAYALEAADVAINCFLGVEGAPCDVGRQHALHIYADNKDQAQRAVKEFADEFGVKWPKAVAKVVDDQEALLAFFDFPAEHWKHLRTTNPIESTFAPVRARTELTKGPESREAGLAMVFKLVEAAERRWRKIDGHELVALVRAGARFKNGKLIGGSSAGRGRRVIKSRSTTLDYFSARIVANQ